MIRSQAQIKTLLLEIAQHDERIRAVLLNGSRANSTISQDAYRDFDVVYLVQAVEDFTLDHQWVNVFGETIITQLPDQMVIDQPNRDSYSYLMLFIDGNRINLTLFPVGLVQPNYWPDSLTVCWLDKDALFTGLPTASLTDYHIKLPTSKEFADTCNEFWWVSTYVVKGLARQQIPYAKDMMETAVRPTFMKMISWQMGAQTNVPVGFGKSGQFIRPVLGDSFYEQVLNTYAGGDREENWQALLRKTAPFTVLTREVANKLGYAINWQEVEQTQSYIQQRYEWHSPQA